MAKVFIGTSGWKYAHWAKGVFYPQGLAQSKWLEYYAGFFNAIELNVTFYRHIQKKIFQQWNKTTPEDFYFVVKGSRFITHIKKLKDIKEPLGLFIDNVRGLEDKIAAILWQFPPGFKKDLRRLELFLKLLVKTKIRQVVEFRNETWFDKKVYDLLRKYNVCLCIAHSSVYLCVKEITADFLYLRFHGAQSLYSSSYSDEELKAWADFTKGYKTRDIFVFFNNDADCFAVKNALNFKELLQQ